MRLSKFFIIILGVTFLAVLYVYQQSKIIDLAYQEQERLALLEKTIDKNNSLNYAFKQNISLVSIGELWQDGDFEWPHREQLVSLSTMQRTPRNNKQAEKRESLFTRFLGLKSQAEATPVKAQ